MRLYSGPLSMFGAKVEIAALEKGLPVKVFMVRMSRRRAMNPSIRTCCGSIPSGRRRC